MSYESMLETLVGVLTSSSRKDRLTRVVPNAGPAGGGVVTSAGGGGAVGGPGWANALDATNPAPSGPGGGDGGAAGQSPATPAPQPAAAKPAISEASLRDQLQQVDLYDLSGEKAAAEALKREDAFKAQDLARKAEQTKDFFAEQDRQHEATLNQARADAARELDAKRQQEFWNDKHATEMQAGMEKELAALSAAAKQAHGEWRGDFTKGICREDAAEAINAQIDGKVGMYKERMNDLKTNAFDAAEKADAYKEKLGAEAAPVIEQKTEQLHQEHFPEFRLAAQQPEMAPPAPAPTPPPPEPTPAAPSGPGSGGGDGSPFAGNPGPPAPTQAPTPLPVPAPAPAPKMSV